METILVQWEAFAATRLPGSARMTPSSSVGARPIDFSAELRWSAELTNRWPQLPESVARGRAKPAAASRPQNGVRLCCGLWGFDINQLAAEYRALRASVLRLWMDACQPETPGPEDIIRFNEAIDQALAESIGFFSAQVDQSRNLLLGMIGHDMRSPLQTIQTIATYLAALTAGEKVSEAASCLILSGARMKALLDDLVDFNRTRLGLGINIAPTNVDLASLFANELEQLRAAHPDRRLELEAVGDTQGLGTARACSSCLTTWC